MNVLTVTLNPCVDKTLTVSRVVPDRKLPVREVRRDPGGGGINVARVVHRLGGSVGTLWNCGGRGGEVLAELLDREGVPHHPQPMQDETRENLIVTDDSTGQQYRFGMPGPALTPEERSAWEDRLRHWPDPPAIAVFSGSLPSEAPLEWYGQLLAGWPDTTRVVVDTKRDALSKALDCGIYLAKPNVHELEQIVDRELQDDEEIVDAASEIIERGGAKVILVSLGRGGAVVVTAEGGQRFAAPAVNVKSKVGAGDSMVGGLVYALAEGQELLDAVQMSVAAGAAAVTTSGTDLCHRADVLRLLAQVKPDE